MSRPALGEKEEASKRGEDERAHLEDKRRERKKEKKRKEKRKNKCKEKMEMVTVGI
jgi:hypothetical protein